MILSSSTLQDSQIFHSPGFSDLPQSRILRSYAVQDSQLFHALQNPQLFHSSGFSALPQSRILSSFTVQVSRTRGVSIFINYCPAAAIQRKVKEKERDTGLITRMRLAAV
jgi:hypothetical protein